MNKSFLLKTLSQYYNFARAGYDLNLDLFMTARLNELKKRLKKADDSVMKILVMLQDSDEALEANYKLENLKAEFPELNVPEKY